jgi:hypothetical protein
MTEAPDNPSPVIISIGLGSPIHQFGGSSFLTTGAAAARRESAHTSKAMDCTHRCKAGLTFRTIFPHKGRAILLKTAVQGAHGLLCPWQGTRVNALAVWREQAYARSLSRCLEAEAKRKFDLAFGTQNDALHLAEIAVV